MTGVELVGALIKPILDGWQFIRGLLPKRDDNTFRVPKRTLILIPDTQPLALRWSIGPAPDGGKGIFLALSFQATNIASCAVRPSDVRVNWPRNVEIIQKIIMTGRDEGDFRYRNMIAAGDIDDVSICLFLRQSWAKPGDDLPIHIGVVDQFNNQHRLKIRCRFAG